MKPNLFIAAIAIAISAAIGSLALAGGMGGGGMGGGGHGMMGGGQMMDSGRGNITPYPDQYNRYNRSDEPDRYGPTETNQLRQEIREKRQELSELYGSEKPDKDLIDKKIDELSKLEAELDHRLSETKYQRR
jgi:Spy/CpxP family protein refolding chaperone